jgi:Cdc6-like AAA superfamily ATPase
MEKIHKLTVLPVKKTNKKTQYNIPSPLPQPAFTLLMVAPTCSGKSVLLTNMLKNVMYGYHNVFEQIYYISPTVMLDDTLKAIAKDDEIVKIHEPEELEMMDLILSDIVKEQKKKDEDERKPLLVVLDDCIEYFSNHSVLNNLPSLSRHYQISFIVLSQAYSALGSRFRKNTTHLIVFKLYNKKDLKAIEDEIGSNYEDFIEHYNIATKEKYNFLYLNNTDKSVYHNFITKLSQD